MTTSRITFLQLNYGFLKNVEVKTAVGNMFAKMPEVSNFLETAVKVTADGIVTGLVFYIDSLDYKRIIDNVKTINKLGIGTISSVAINGCHNNTVCFFTTVSGTMQEVATKWQKANSVAKQFIPCGMYPIDEDQTYLFGNFNFREVRDFNAEQKNAAIGDWKKQVIGLCENIGNLHEPHFADTGLIIF